MYSGFVSVLKVEMDWGNSDTQGLERQVSLWFCHLDRFENTLNTDQRGRKTCISSFDRYLCSIYHVPWLSERNRPAAAHMILGYSDVSISDLWTLMKPLWPFPLPFFLLSITITRNIQLLFDPICCKDLFL